MKRCKKIYLASGNEHGMAWQLSLNVSVEEPRWCGTFYLAETTKLHQQKTIHLAGGGTKYELQLSINVSAKQEKWSGNFYFKK